MKCLILAAILVVMAVNVEGHVDPKLDPEVFKKMRPCYEERVIRDKSRSLPMTLDYFLYLVEKIQRHPEMKSWNAAGMASALLERFQMNGLIDNFRDEYTVAFSSEEQVKSKVVKEFLVVAPAHYVENTLLPEEECALHFMLSFSNNNTNPSRNGDYEPNYIYYPRSSGLIYSGVFGNLALGPVLQGIAVAPVSVYKTVGGVIDSTGGQLVYRDGDVDAVKSYPFSNIYAATISAELGQTTKWSLDNSFREIQTYVGPKGYWNSTYCPSNYTLTENSAEAVTMATAAEIVGAIDGFVIASKMQEGLPQTDAVKLAQVIRMYYGKGLLQNAYSACERRNQFGRLATNLQQQTEYFTYAYGAAVAGYFEVSDVTTYVGNVITDFKRDYADNIFLDCNQSSSVYFASGRADKHELKNDVFFVIDVDSKNSDDGFWEQKEFVMNLMREVDSMLNGSRYGLYSNGQGTNKKKFPLDPFYSSARRRCEILQEVIEPTSTNMPDTIRYVKEEISILKNQQNANMVPLAPGKVIIFIYLESDFNNREDIQREIDHLKWEHPDVTLLAVGREAEPLKMLVRDEERDIFHKSGEPIVSQVPKILKRLTMVPVTVEYPRCFEGNQDLESSYVGYEYVYSTTYQWFSVPQIYFNTSSDLKLQIRSDFGTVRVCHTRYRPETFTSNVPSFESEQCQEVTTSGSNSGEPLAEFGPMEPCYDYPDGGCPNFYLHVQGKTKSATEVCKSDTCDSLHQIQLTFTHSNMRCAGSFTGVEISFLLMSVLVSIFTLWA